MILTQRCVLARIEESDFPELAKLHATPETREFLGGAITPDAFADKFEELKQSSDIFSRTIHLKDNRKFVGLISLTPHHDGKDREISFQILPEFWGQGLAVETVGAIITHAFSSLKMPRLVAETQAANARSRKLLERLGMTPLKFITRFGEDQIIYAMDRKKAGQIPDL